MARPAPEQPSQFTVFMQRTLRPVDIAEPVPQWPFRSVTPEQWAALSPKIRRNYDAMLAELIGFQKRGA